MARQREDTRTLSLFDWTPPVVEHLPESVRAISFRARMSKAVATTLKECERSRAEIAAEMSALLERDISEHMLDAYASEAREEHAINPERLWALCTVTGDWRPVAVLLEGSDKAIIDRRYLAAVKEAMAQAEIERLEAVRRAAIAYGSLKGTIASVRPLDDRRRVLALDADGRRLICVVALDAEGGDLTVTVEPFDARVLVANATAILCGRTWTGSVARLCNALAAALVAAGGTP